MSGPSNSFTATTTLRHARSFSEQPSEVPQNARYPVLGDTVTQGCLGHHLRPRSAGCTLPKASLWSSEGGKSRNVHRTGT